MEDSPAIDLFTVNNVDDVDTPPPSPREMGQPVSLVNTILDKSDVERGQSDENHC